jgi:xanthine dehydrogenase YagR molybdenum-binding subunit
MSITGRRRKAFPMPLAILPARSPCPQSNIHVDMQYIGGGFGSKFQAEAFGVQCAQLSKASGGRPVRLFLDRDLELLNMGNRPSGFGNIKVAAKKDGTITAWQSQTWSTGGLGGGGFGAELFPYVYRQVPNRRINHTAVSTNCGSARAWRAPNHPQASYLTCSALDDLAAKLNMDPLDLFLKNAGYTARADAYRAQLQKAAELMEWKRTGIRAVRAQVRCGEGLASAWGHGAGRVTRASALRRFIPTARLWLSWAARIWARGHARLSRWWPQKPWACLFPRFR